jgi:hypothetical protein
MDMNHSERDIEASTNARIINSGFTGFDLSPNYLLRKIRSEYTESYSNSQEF